MGHLPPQIQFLLALSGYVCAFVLTATCVVWLLERPLRKRSPKTTAGVGAPTLPPPVGPRKDMR
jgi:peptidoglycan/LPS O-acetylase OafA/YrhL